MNRILLKVTGSIAAFKAAALTSKLVQEGFDVRVVLSGAAKEFVGAATFEGLTRNPVGEDTFARGEAMAHIDLARWAELTVVYPASANTLTKLASGRAEDLVGTLFLAHDFKTPYWIVPAMNPSMMAHPAVSEAVEKLRTWGLRVLDPAQGRMACGEVGDGRLIEPEAMLEEIRGHFQASKMSRGQKVLITAGGTTEKIDPVRVITNISTGETGVRVANRLARAGLDATLLLAESSPFRAEVLPQVKLSTYRSFDDLDAALKRELGAQSYDFAIHAAAVSDYRIDRVENTSGVALDQDTKIGSKDSLCLLLKPTPKILARLRGYSKNPELRIISFKLSTAASPESSAKDGGELAGYDSDFIVFNSVSAIERGSDRHSGEILERKDGGGYRRTSSFQTKTELSDAVLRLCEGNL